jgi:DNA-binding transcriptional ArsR family regulator
MLETLNALAETNRLRILTQLRKRPHSVGELSELLEMRQPQVSKHLQVLQKAGLVHVLVFAQKRIYSLLPQPLIELESWLSGFLDIPSVKAMERAKGTKK